MKPAIVTGLERGMPYGFCLDDCWLRDLNINEEVFQGCAFARLSVVVAAYCDTK
jgi:hypothetical protein